MKRLIPVLSLIAAVVLLLMLNFTTPADVGPLGVLVFFGASYVLIFGLAYLIVRIFGAVLGKKSGKKQGLYASVIAFGPIMLLLAQSIGTMSVWTVGLVALFVILGCFLIAKRGSR